MHLACTLLIYFTAIRLIFVLLAAEILAIPDNKRDEPPLFWPFLGSIRGLIRWLRDAKVD